MKKTYEAPEAQIVRFETDSVLNQSGINTPVYPL